MRKGKTVVLRNALTLMKKWTSVILLISVSIQLVTAQPDSTYSFAKHHYWATFGAGSTPPRLSHLDYGGTYLLDNKKAFQINYYHIPQWHYVVPNKLKDLQSIVLSYGRNWSMNRISAVILTAGVSYGKGTYYGRDTSKVQYWGPGYSEPVCIETPYEYLGLYISGYYFLRTRFYGVGLKMYLNIHKHSDCGFTICQNLGYLNKKRVRK